MILRRPLWSIEKMPLAVVIYVAAFWGYLDIRGNGPISYSMMAILIGTPILWIVRFTFGRALSAWLIQGDETGEMTTTKEIALSAGSRGGAW